MPGRFVSIFSLASTRPRSFASPCSMSRSSPLVLARRLTAMSTYSPLKLFSPSGVLATTFFRSPSDLIVRQSLLHESFQSTGIGTAANRHEHILATETLFPIGRAGDDLLQIAFRSDRSPVLAP